MAKTTTDWIAIEGAYRAGVGSLRDIAAEYGITEGAIRKRAKRDGWVRDPEGIKRERVKAIMTGTLEGTQYAQETINREAEEDARDMRLGLQAARLGLQVAALGLKAMKDDGAAEPGKTKVWSETVALNINTIRRIRGLDDAKQQASITIERSYGRTARA